MFGDSRCDEAAEERSPVAHPSLVSRTLELMMKLDSVTVMEDSVIKQLTECLEQLNSVSENADESNLSGRIEKHIHTVYSLLNKLFNGKYIITMCI